MLHALLVDTAHDLVQFRIHLFRCPGDVHCVLCHLETRGRDTTRINRLTRGEKLVMLNKQVYSFRRTTHIGYFGYAQCLIGDQCFCVLFIQLVLGSAWQCDINFLLPRFLAGIEG